MEDYQEHSLSSRVFQKIRDNILDGTYREHDELRENTIGKELGVSRTPVREALRQLLHVMQNLKRQGYEQNETAGGV